MVTSLYVVCCSVRVWSLPVMPLFFGFFFFFKSGPFSLFVTSILVDKRRDRRVCDGLVWVTLGTGCSGVISCLSARCCNLAEKRLSPEHHGQQMIFWPLLVQNLHYSRSTGEYYHVPHLSTHRLLTVSISWYLPGKALIF